MKFSLHVGAQYSQENFSLSQLIIAIKNLFDAEGLPGFLVFFVKHFETELLNSGVSCPRCKSPRCHVHTSRSRTIKTTIGEAALDLMRMRCQACKKTFMPMGPFLDLDRFSRKSRELEKLSLETLSEESFRRSAAQLEENLGIELPYTTLHGWFMKTKSIWVSLKQRVETLIADGTGYKMKPMEGSNRGEVRIVVGVTRDGSVVPYGAWTEASWKNIGKLLKKTNTPSEKVKFRPIAKTLVSDGEEELIRSLKKLADSQQRCLFHMTYDLDGILRYKDGASKDEASRFKADLNGIIAIEVPPEDVEPLKNIENKLLIEVKTKSAEKKLDELIATLRALSYRKAANYIENAKANMFTYVYNWICLGITNPRVSSLIERMMREIGRRIKKIGHGWSPKGAERMTRLILLQITNQKAWTEHWKEKMGYDAQIKLSFLGVTAES